MMITHSAFVSVHFRKSRRGMVNLVSVSLSPEVVRLGVCDKPLPSAGSKQEAYQIMKQIDPDKNIQHSSFSRHLLFTALSAKTNHLRFIAFSRLTLTCKLAYFRKVRDTPHTTHTGCVPSRLRTLGKPI